MQNRILVITVLFTALAGLSCGREPDDRLADQIIGLERAALDRWGKGDPQGYIEAMAPDVTYFDPTQATRIDGLDAMKELVKPITGKIKVDRFEMLGPKVQQYGDLAVLTFNLVSYVKAPDGSSVAAARWNTTEVYRRVDGAWRIAHSHWSYTRPELKQPLPAPAD